MRPVYKQMGHDFPDDMPPLIPVTFTEIEEFNAAIKVEAERSWLSRTQLSARTTDSDQT